MKKLAHRIKLSDPGGTWSTSDFPAFVISVDVVAIVCYFIVFAVWGLVFLLAAQQIGAQ